MLNPFLEEYGKGGRAPGPGLLAVDRPSLFYLPIVFVQFCLHHPCWNFRPTEKWNMLLMVREWTQLLSQSNLIHQLAGLACKAVSRWVCPCCSPSGSRPSPTTPSPFVTFTLRVYPGLLIILSGDCHLMIFFQKEVCPRHKLKTFTWLGIYSSGMST